MRPFEDAVASELAELLRAGVPTRGIHITVREMVVTRMERGRLGAREVSDATEEAVRAACRLVRELGAPDELVEIVCRGGAGPWRRKRPVAARGDDRGARGPGGVGNGASRRDHLALARAASRALVGRLVLCASNIRDDWEVDDVRIKNRDGSRGCGVVGA